MQQFENYFSATTLAAMASWIVCQLETKFSRPYQEIGGCCVYRLFSRPRKLKLFSTVQNFVLLFAWILCSLTPNNNFFIIACILKRLMSEQSCLQLQRHCSKSQQRYVEIYVQLLFPVLDAGCVDKHNHWFKRFFTTVVWFGPDPKASVIFKKQACKNLRNKFCESSFYCLSRSIFSWTHWRWRHLQNNYH